MKTQATIVFTGGGSAGHVIPNLELIATLQQRGWQVSYIGSKDGVERGIVARSNIAYQGITCGKLRRYFSWKNFIDPFKIIWGTLQAYANLTKLKPNIVFSKGGFVAFPVVVAAWLRGIPVIAHESDFTPGLANKLSFPFATHICLTFAEAQKYFKQQQKLVVTGTPIRAILFKGDAAKGRALCDFTHDKPVLMIIGGGQGAAVINQSIRAVLPQLLEQLNIIHICGAGKVAASLLNIAGYRQFDYVDQNLEHLYACADIVISRAGANSVYEILALQKPHIFVPLSLKASRGDQIFNARFFAKQGLSKVLDEDTLTSEQLLATIKEILSDYTTIKAKLTDYSVHSGTDAIVKLIETTVNK